jgi:hypothetical protein
MLGTVVAADRRMAQKLNPERNLSKGVAQGKAFGLVPDLHCNMRKLSLRPRSKLYQEAAMNQGDRVRIRPGSAVPEGWKVPAGATGTVLTSYNLLARLRPPTRECVDLDLGAHQILWGLRADQLELLPAEVHPSKG